MAHGAHRPHAAGEQLLADEQQVFYGFYTRIVQCIGLLVGWGRAASGCCGAVTHYSYAARGSE